MSSSKYEENGPPSIEEAKEYFVREVLPKNPETDEIFSVCESPMGLASFGVGVTLYFKLLVWMSILFVIQAAVSLSNVVYNLGGNRAPAGSGIVVQMTIANRFGDQIPPVQGTFEFVAILVCLLFWLIVKKRQVAVARKIDAKTLSASDYSIWVEDLPEDVIDPREYLDFFTKPESNQEVDFPIVEITMALDNGEIVHLLQEMEKLEDEMRYKEVKKGGELEATDGCCAKDLTYYENKKAKLQAKLDKERETTHKPAKLFVTYEKQVDVDRVIEIFNYSNIFTKVLNLIFCCCPCSFGVPTFRGNRLRVERAVEPSDVIWKNQHVSRWSQQVRGVRTIVGGLIFVAAVTGIIYAVKEAGKSANGVNNTSLTVLASFIVTILNQVLVRGLIKLSQSARAHSVSQQDSRLMILLLAAQFSTTGLIILVSTLLVESDPYKRFVTLGDQATFIVLADAFTSNIVRILRPFDHLKKDYLAKKALTQWKMNSFFAGMDFVLAERYASVLKTLFVIFTYGSIAPVVFILGTVCFIITYYVDKYYLLRLSHNPPLLDEKLSFQLHWILPAAIAGRGFMSGLFMGQVPNNGTAAGLAFAGMGVALAMLVLQVFPFLLNSPMLRCFKCLFDDDANLQDDEEAMTAPSYNNIPTPIERYIPPGPVEEIASQVASVPGRMPPLDVKKWTPADGIEGQGPGAGAFVPPPQQNTDPQNVVLMQQMGAGPGSPGMMPPQQQMITAACFQCQGAFQAPAGVAQVQCPNCGAVNQFQAPPMGPPQ